MARDCESQDWAGRQAAWKSYCIENNLHPDQVVSHEAAHAVVGYLMGCRVRCLSVDPDVIRRRNHPKSAGIVDISCVDNDYADMVMTCAGEESDRANGFYEMLTIEQQVLAYGGDRSKVDEMANKMANMQIANNKDFAIQARKHARDLVIEEKVHEAINAVTAHLQSRGTLNEDIFKLVLLSYWEELKSVAAKYIV